MHYSHDIGILGRNSVLALFLLMPWTLRAESSAAPLRLPHLSRQQTVELEAGKQAALNPRLDFLSPEASAVKVSLESLDDGSLFALSARLEKLAVLNPESLDQILNEIPAIGSSSPVSISLQAFVKSDPKAKATLVGIVKDVLFSRLEGEGSSLSERLAELERQEEKRNRERLRELEEKLESVLGGGGSGPGSGESTAGAPPPASSPASARKSKEEPYSPEDRHGEKKSADNRLNEILKSLDSKKTDDASPDEKGASAQSATQKKKPNETKTGPASTDPPSSPMEPSQLSQGTSTPKPGLNGNFIGLSPIAPPGNPNSAAGAALGDAPAGASFGPVQGFVGSGIAAASAGQGFPFFTSDSPGAPPAPQKFEYSRDNPYGNSNGDGAVSVSDNGEEGWDGETTEKISVSSEVHFDKKERSSVRLLTVQDQPAFMKALSLAISGLCTKGSLDCEQSGKGARP